MACSISQHRHVIDRKGRSDPEDIYKAKVGQKILIDTVKPVVKLTTAERTGEEIMVAWEIQEEHPDWPTLRLEYRVGDLPNGQWTPLMIKPGERGNYRFRPGLPGPVTVRLSLRDLAGNEGIEEKVVAGTQIDQAVTTTVFSPPCPHCRRAIAMPHRYRLRGAACWGMLPGGGSGTPPRPCDPCEPRDARHQRTGLAAAGPLRNLGSRSGSDCGFDFGFSGRTQRHEQHDADSRCIAAFADRQQERGETRPGFNVAKGFSSAPRGLAPWTST